MAEIEISNSVALPSPYCTLYGDRGTLVYGQNQKMIHLKYLNPLFRWPEGHAVEGTHARSGNTFGTLDLPWNEETRPVERDLDMWEYVELEMVQHLYAAIRVGVAFPIRNKDALEVVRITEIVKQQNPQYSWIG